MCANAPEVMGLATNVGFKQRILVDAANAVAVAGGRIVSGHNRSYGGMNMYDQPPSNKPCPMIKQIPK